MSNLIKESFNNEENVETVSIKETKKIKKTIKKLKRQYKKTEYKISKKTELCFKKNDNLFPISNFIPLPIRNIIVDDGINISHQIEMEGILEGNQLLPPICIPIEELQKPGCFEAHWGFPCILYPNVSKAYEHMRTALKIASIDIQTSKIFNHIGWQEINGNWYYLHGKGAIGENEIEVKMDPSLDKYCIKKNKDMGEKAAYQLVMELLNVANEEVTIPLLAYSMLSFINLPLKEAGHEVKFTLWIHGETGSRKTTLAKTFTNIFGENNEISTATFKDTQAAIEKLAFEYKDCTLLLDDFHPSTNRQEKDEMNRKAEHFVRIYGDRVTKRRMFSNMDKQKEFPPRGLLIVTGEDFISGMSTTARCFSVPIQKDNVNLKNLTHSQRRPIFIPTASYYYIKYLASRMNELPKILKQKFLDYREEFKSDELHGRAAENLAWLLLSYELYLEYGKSIGKINEEAMLDNLIQARDIFSKLVERQFVETTSEDSISMYLHAIKELIVSNQVHIDSLNTNSNSKLKIGWEDEEFYYLLPELTYSCVMNFWKLQNKVFPISSRKLHEMLQLKGIIKVEEVFKDGNATYKRTVKKKVYGEVRIRALHIKKHEMENYLK